jgi:hypothetical protein
VYLIFSGITDGAERREGGGRDLTSADVGTELMCVESFEIVLGVNLRIVIRTTAIR